MRTLVKGMERAAEYARTSLWVVPAAAAILAVLGGVASVAVDHGTNAHLGFSGGAVGARSVLSTIAAAMITFTGLVFSITIVVLQLASGQFSPRVMRTFLRDRTSKVALATFVATFSFAFTVLRATRADAVPGISVTIAIVLVFVSMGVFIHYINHTAHAIRAVSIIESVAAETRESLERNFPAGFASPPPDILLPRAGEQVVVPNRRMPGVVTGFDSEQIVERASSAGGVVALLAGVGDFVPRGAPLLALRAVTAESCDVEACVSLGQERTMRQDMAFGVRQLVDLATKALSPGINDPTTAVQAIDQIHDLLRQLAIRPIPSGQAADGDGVVRFVYPQMGWDDYVSLAFDEVRQYGAGSLQIHRRVRSVLEDLLTITIPDRQPALRDQLRALAAAAERAFPDARDRIAAEYADNQGVGS